MSFRLKTRSLLERYTTDHVVLGWAFAIVGAVIYASVSEHPITPRAMADVNGDGVEDVIVTRLGSTMFEESVGYYDGLRIRKDEEGNYFARGNPTPAARYLLKADTSIGITEQ